MAETQPEKVELIRRVEIYRGDNLWSVYEYDEKGNETITGTMKGDKPKKGDEEKYFDGNGNRTDEIGRKFSR